MKPPPYSEASVEPLRRDDQILERVTELVGHAIRRQLWLLALDDDDVQLPILIPISDYPNAKYAEPRQLQRLLTGVGDSMGASQLIVVLERRGDSTLTVDDKKWAKLLSAALAEHKLRLRAVLVSHTTGVAWMPRDEFAQ